MRGPKFQWKIFIDVNESYVIRHTKALLQEMKIRIDCLLNCYRSSLADVTQHELGVKKKMGGFWVIFIAG